MRTRTSRIVLTILSLVLCTLQRRLYFGAILPANSSYPFSIRTITPVFHVANEIIQGREDLRNYTIEVTYYDSGPNVAKAPNSAYTIHMDAARNNTHVDAFFGPVVDEALAPVARQANKWGIPVLTGGGVSIMFDDKRYFASLIRMGPVKIRDAVHVIEYFMEHNRWTRAKLLVTRQSHNAVGMANVCHRLSAHAEGHPNLFISEAYIRDDYEDMLLQEVGEEYAIVIFCAPPDVTRAIMSAADRLNFNNGHYVFVLLDLFRTETENRYPWHRTDDSARGNEAAKVSYRRVFIINIPRPHDDKLHHMFGRIREKAAQISGGNTRQNDNMDYYLAVFYDAVLTFVQAMYDVEVTYHQSGDMGDLVIHRILNSTHEGLTGKIAFKDTGERLTEYAVLQMVRGVKRSGKFRVIARCRVDQHKYQVIHDEDWGWFDDTVPPDKPVCPHYSDCGQVFHYFDEFVIAVAALIGVIIISCYAYHRCKLSLELSNVEWRIRWEDVRIEQVTFQRRFTAMATPESSVMYIPVNEKAADSHRFTRVGFVRGTRVSIKFLRRDRFTIDRCALRELKYFLSIENDHICKFVGACLDLPNQSIMTEYCEKGTLENILENDHITLDWMIRFSLVHDIAKGMSFIHSSEFRSHGSLTSRNCLVDARFVLKITGFGLNFLLDRTIPMGIKDFRRYRSKLWTSPELIRLKSAPTNGTQKGDVYSFAIVCQEIVYRRAVFHLEEHEIISVKEKYECVKKGVQPLMRPTLHSGDCTNDDFYELITRSWSEEPNDRPSFHEILTIIRKVNKMCESDDIMDNLFRRLEIYANDLESLVVHRTEAFMDEKERADELLHLLLPLTVAQQLIKGETVPPESYDSVTIFFSDIVGFTALSASCTSMDVIGMINDLYTLFDSITDNFDVYKVETIGDAYMVVSGLPIRNGIQHAAEIACMALELLSAVKTFHVRFRPDEKLQIRIGIHSGPVCAGVVGHKMPRYCLFGNTVTTAAKYESKGLPLNIHISEETRQLLDEIGGFQIEKRGEIEMKPRGRVTTYWLLSTSVSYDIHKHVMGNRQNRSIRRRALVSAEHMPPSSQRGSMDTDQRGTIASSVTSTAILASFKRLQSQASMTVDKPRVLPDRDEYYLQKKFVRAWLASMNTNERSVDTSRGVGIPASGYVRRHSRPSRGRRDTLSDKSESDKKDRPRKISWRIKIPSLKQEKATSSTASNDDALLAKTRHNRQVHFNAFRLDKRRRDTKSRVFPEHVSEMGKAGGKISRDERIELDRKHWAKRQELLREIAEYAKVSIPSHYYRFPYTNYGKARVHRKRRIAPKISSESSQHLVPPNQLEVINSESPSPGSTTPDIYHVQNAQDASTDILPMSSTLLGIHKSIVGRFH